MNRSLTFTVQNITLEESLSWCRLDVYYVNIFGCITNVHVIDEKRKKLDGKCKKCVFLRLSKGSKRYKLFNPLIKKIVTSRIIVFDEKITWN